MMRTKLLASLLTGVVILSVGIGRSFSRPDEAEPESKTASGTVFDDLNGNGTLDDGEPGVPGVRVSNGRVLATTDENGRYELPVTDDTILFVVKPRNRRTPVDEFQLPRFYYIHKPHGSPKLKFPGVEPTGPLPAAVNFPLYPQEEPDQFRAVLFGDTQPRNVKEVEYITHDVVEELIGVDAAFGVTLGDIVFDDLDVFQPLVESIALIGIPWYNVIGNHDINYDARNDFESDETFERVFGPAYYSFDYGPTHFIVLDDVEWHIPDGKTGGTYRGGLGPEQLEFVKNDLALIPEDQLVVLMMHIPLVNVEDRQELYRLIEQRPFCVSISGHTHYQEHVFITDEDGWQGPEPHHHIINVTVCGSWWRGPPGERGWPESAMADGVPNGYSIISFDGHDYEFDYKAAGRDADYQMVVHAPETVMAGMEAETKVTVNVFNGSERSTVRMRIDGDGEWTDIPRTPGEDPVFRASYDRDTSLAEKPWSSLPAPRVTGHIWSGSLPAGLTPGLHWIDVEATDVNGRTHSGRRIIRVTPAVEAVVGE